MVLCDYLSLTVPTDTAPRFRSELLAFLLSEGVEPTHTEGVWMASQGGGTAKVFNRGPVLACSFSGALLGLLRASGAYRELLALLSSVPHRVTRLDACLDLPEDAAAHLDRAFTAALAGKVWLGQRAVPTHAIGRVQRPALYASENLSGSVYIGRRGDDRRLTVYDKRNERLDAGEEDPGPLVRYELSVGKGGRARVSLRDAEDPAPLFWSVVGGQLLPKPPGVPAWEPTGEGFTVPRGLVLDPLELLYRACEHSGALAKLGRQAALCGPAEAPDRDPPGLTVLLAAARAAYRLGAGTSPSATASATA